MKISKNIKKIRSFKKLSQQAFAESFDLTRASVSAYEDGRAKPKTEVMMRIAKFFNIPLEVFINEELTINQLTHFGENAQHIHTEQPASNVQFNVRYLSDANTEEFLKTQDFTQVNRLPVISFPFPVKASELAFSVNEDIFNIRLNNITAGDIIFCQKVKLFSKTEHSNYLVMFNDNYLISEFAYDTQKKCLVNPANPIEKVFEDETLGIFKIISVLSNNLTSQTQSPADEVRQSQKKLNKYLKI